MGFFSKLIGRTPRPEAILTEAIERLQIGIFTNLLLQYRSWPDPSEAALLADCVLSYAILVNPSTLESQDYQKIHPALILEKALELSENTLFFDALSYLYAAIILLLVLRTKNPCSEESNLLCARATELSIYIPNTHDICGSGDGIKCAEAIGKFAESYLQRALGR